MGKSTISMAIFHCYVSSPEGSLIGDQNHWTGEAEEMAQVLQQGKLRHGKLQGGAPLTIAL